MNKQTGAILLVAGTCIGSGMIALPMVLAKVALIPSIFLMLLMWAIIYFSAILTLELNLHAGKASSLGELGKKFSGKIAELIGISSFKALSYALVAVYLYAGASVIQKMFEFDNFIQVTSIYAFISFLILTFPLKLIDYINRLLFIGLLTVIIVLVLSLTTEIHWYNLPLLNGNYENISSWIIAAPVVFTAFGFHGSIPTLIEYCDNDPKILKRVFLWGCCIPSIVYIVWTFSVLAVVHHNNPDLYNQMILGKVDVGDLVQALSVIVNSKSVQLLIWWISFFAIVTSLLGVSLSLCNTINNMLSSKLKKTSNIVASLATIFPSYVLAVFIPNAFIAVLGFAGMILAIIAILLPAYLIVKINPSKFYCNELNINSMVTLLTLTGVLIVASEVLNMIRV